MSIDLALENIWHSYHLFRKGKKTNTLLDHFQYHLERELFTLWRDLNDGTYKHGTYHKFVVNDNKKRAISVGPIRDRVVHRLLYEYLVKLYDKTFIYDAWSCRKGKGLIGAIERTQYFMHNYPGSYIWKADISKFFDHVNHAVLRRLLSMRIENTKALNLLFEVIDSFEITRDCGIPIGNLTSQIFANIYLNELDRYVQHIIKPLAYLRYGDDFVIFDKNITKLEQIRVKSNVFLEQELKLCLNCKCNLIINAKQGLKFLGVQIYRRGRKLNKRNTTRINRRLNYNNLASYYGLVKKHQSERKVKEWQWEVTHFL